MLHFSGSPDLILLYVLFHQLWSYAALFRVTWSHPAVCCFTRVELCCTFQSHLISSHCMLFYQLWNYAALFRVTWSHPTVMFCFTNSEIMLHFSGSPDLIPLYVLFHQLWSYAALFRVTWSHPAVCSVSPTLELCCTFQGHLISSRCMFCFTNSGVMLHFSGSPDLILLYVPFHQLWSYAALFRVTWSHPAVCSVSPTLELCCTFQGHLISSRCMFCFTNSGVMLHFSGSPDLIPLYVLFHQLWSYAALFRVTWSHPTVCSVSPTLELCCTFQGHLISSCCMFCFTNSGVMLHFSGSPDIPLYVLFHQLCSSANTWCLHLPSAHLKTSGRHASFYSAPLLWNNLPYSLQHFFLNITSRSIVSPLDSECLACVHVSGWFCVCVCVCVCTCMRVLKVMKKISNEVL